MQYKRKTHTKQIKECHSLFFFLEFLVINAIEINRIFFVCWTPLPPFSPSLCYSILRSDKITEGSATLRNSNVIIHHRFKFNSDTLNRWANIVDPNNNNRHLWWNWWNHCKNEQKRMKDRDDFEWNKQFRTHTHNHTTNSNLFY